MRVLLVAVPSLALLSVACSSSNAKTDAEYEHQVVTGMHDARLSDVEALHQASIDLQEAAPEPKGRGWDADKDAHAIDAMTAAWLRARGAYERTEGALAPLFPETDGAI